jgi:hypothetical protein
MESKSLINLAKSPIGLKIVPPTSLILLVFFYFSFRRFIMVEEGIALPFPNLNFLLYLSS